MIVYMYIIGQFMNLNYAPGSCIMIMLNPGQARPGQVCRSAEIQDHGSHKAARARATCGTSGASSYERLTSLSGRHSARRESPLPLSEAHCGTPQSPSVRRSLAAAADRNSSS